MKTIERKYISLAENRREHYDLQNSSRPIVTTWTATVEGNLSTGEHIYMYREGETSEEAYRALEAALNEQKWTIKV